ncbi:MAG: polysaccharide lyase 8 family protein [Deltaproteobacteria bacterium]|nr:polysaccharide lyase 8 family protein [Deltaproteobacteria bacterium]
MKKDSLPRVARGLVPLVRPWCWRVVSLTCFVGLLAPATSALASPQDVATLIARLQADIIAKQSTSSASSDLTKQGTDGCWSDINYADRTRATWDPSKHVGRLLGMAVAYHKPGHAAYQSAAMRSAVMKGIDCWHLKNPRSDNWWWNDLGKQLRLGPMGIVMDKELDTSHRSFIVAELPTVPSRTGQNLVWAAEGVIYRGCLEKNETRIKTGLAGIKSTIVVTTGEGIQRDWSFHQHGPQLYNAGYGKSFVRDTAHWARHTRGISFAFTSKQISLLSSLLLDGDRWMVRGAFFDSSADGRELSRPGRTSGGLISPCTDLALVDKVRAKELTTFADHLRVKKGHLVSGNRHFWRSDFMVHQRPSYYVSVKMCSSRTTGTEMMNQENLLGYWLPFGLTYIVRRGDEYKDIFPSWDWTLLPGVTAVDSGGKLTTTYQSQGPSFVGGVSDGRFGVAAMTLDKAHLQAKKGWFFFDDEMVALGAGISSSDTHRIRTGISQTLLKGNVTVNGAVIARGNHMLLATRWVYHDGVGYVFPSQYTVHMVNEGRKGSWKRINATGSATVVSRDVFTLWMDHGRNPQGKSYQYIVVPKAKATDVGTYASHIPVRVIVNNANQQGVYHAGLRLWEVAFYHSGQVTLQAGLSLQVNAPCLVIFDEAKTSPRMTVADPRGKLTSVTLTLRRKGEADEVLHVALPSGDKAGKSVTVTARPRPIPPTPDQGGVVTDGAPWFDGTVSSDGAVSADGAKSGEAPEGGCACKVGSRSDGRVPVAPWWLVFLFLVAFRRHGER